MNFKFKKFRDVDNVLQAKITYMISQGVFLLLGLAFIFFAFYSTELIDKPLMAYLLGGVFVIMGGARLFGYFSNDLYRLAFQYDMALGLFNAFLGVLLLIFADRFFIGIGHIISLWVLLDGLFKFQTAIDGRKFGIGKWPVMLTTSIFTCVVGAYCEITLIAGTKIGVLSKIEELIPMMVMIGIALIVDGAENIWHTAYTVKVRVHKKAPEDIYKGAFDKKSKKK